MPGIAGEEWSFLQSALESNATPTLVASTLFGIMRQAGYSLAEIRSMAGYIQEHTRIDKAVNSNDFVSVPNGLPRTPEYSGQPQGMGFRDNMMTISSEKSVFSREECLTIAPLQATPCYLCRSNAEVEETENDHQLTQEIERVCRERGAPYPAHPANPTSHPNRSHGMAMSWLFHNIVSAIQPRMSAFLDRDLIPVQKIATFSVQMVDRCWLHIGGVSHNDNFRAKSHAKSQWCENLARALDQGRNWSSLLSPGCPPGTKVINHS